MLNKLIIAEIGSVHDGSYGNAKNLIKSAADCGADCVKFQTHIAEAESLPDAPNPSYFSDENRIDYFKRTSFSFDQWQALKDQAEACNMMFLSSPFSLESVDLLEKLNINAYKIPSGEITNIPLLEKISILNKPVFLSSGMSNWDELNSAIEVFKNIDLTIMQCSSIYPCPTKNVGLNILDELKNKYEHQIGFSDHTVGFAASIAAAALGATVIEKHFTFSKNMYGSDAKHSMEPKEFKVFCQEVKDTWDMISNPVNKDDVTIYTKMKNVFQKSIVAKHDILKGTKINFNHLAFKKPGSGIPAKDYKKLIGKKSKTTMKRNTLLEMEDFE